MKITQDKKERAVQEMYEHYKITMNSKFTA